MLIDTRRTGGRWPAPVGRSRSGPSGTKSTPPTSMPIGGMMTSFTSDVTIFQNSARSPRRRRVDRIALDREFLGLGSPSVAPRCGPGVSRIRETNRCSLHRETVPQAQREVTPEPEFAASGESLLQLPGGAARRPAVQGACRRGLGRGQPPVAQLDLEVVAGRGVRLVVRIASGSRHLAAPPILTARHRARPSLPRSACARPDAATPAAGARPRASRA